MNFAKQAQNFFARLIIVLLLLLSPSPPIIRRPIRFNCRAIENVKSHTEIERSIPASSASASKPRGSSTNPCMSRCARGREKRHAGSRDAMTHAVRKLRDSARITRERTCVKWKGLAGTRASLHFSSAPEFIWRRLHDGPRPRETYRSIENYFIRDAAIPRRKEQGETVRRRALTRTRALAFLIGK